MTPGRLARIVACTLTLSACGDAGETSTTSETSSSSSTAATTGAPTSTDPTTSPPDPSTTTSDTTSTSDTSSDTTEPIADDTTTSSTTDPTTTTEDPSTSTTSTTTDTGTTGDADDACAIEHAPPVTQVDGLTAVPIDILDLSAVVTIDAATKSANATATLHFRVGPDAGSPLFDLRQVIVGAALDGDPIDPILLKARDLGGGPGATMRVLNAPLLACSEHTLELTYKLQKPGSPESKDLVWEGQTTRVKWDSWNSDLWPGRYLEAWFPANLIFDRFPFDLDITLSNSQVPHLLATNGALETPDDHHWQISYPPSFTALSPMFVLVAADRVETSTVIVDLVDDTKLTLELWRDLDSATDLPTFQSALQLSFDTFIPQVGPYAHGDRFVGYAWNDPGRSMEYDGATTTILEAADHELFHSWWGRSIKPATQNDGWIDEAWDMHSVTIGFNETPIDFMDDPVTLSSQNPWVRITPDAAYDTGERVFAGIAAMVGTAELQLVMRTFYAEHTGELVTTAQLERYLFCSLGEPGVRAVFHRFVYGQFGDPAAPPPDYCD